jgi:hypothetical protein
MYCGFGLWRATRCCALSLMVLIRNHLSPATEVRVAESCMRSALHNPHSNV